jgi:hypothetical protein
MKHNPNKIITHTFLKAMLTYPPGYKCGNFNVGSWFNGKSLFYKTYKIYTNEILNLNFTALDIAKIISTQLMIWGMSDTENHFTDKILEEIYKNWDIICYEGLEKDKNLSLKRDNIDNLIHCIWNATTM